MIARHLLAPLAVFIAATVLLAGCATQSSGKSYSRHEARTAWDVRYGKVVDIDEVTIEGRRSQLGRVGGGIIGYEAARTVGHGAGSRIAGAVGAVAGAVAGEAVEERMTRQDAWQITVELDGGRTIAVVQAKDQGFSPGERVKVFSRRDGAARVAKL